MARDNELTVRHL